MNDNQELKDHLTACEPLVYSQGDFLCGCGGAVFESTGVNSKSVEYTCGTCRRKYAELKFNNPNGAEQIVRQPLDYVKQSDDIKCECGEYLHAGHKCVEPPTFKFPWAIVMLFVGIAFGFIMGVTR